MLTRGNIGCTKCGLCNGRRNVVLFRGSLPCDVLFIGEAPGESEDAIGVPFVGPSGKLLDDMVFSATCSDDGPPECRLCGRTASPNLCHACGCPNPHLAYGITNIVACLPRAPSPLGSGELRTPHKEEAAACQPRLVELIQLANPRMIVVLGDIAKRFFPKHIRQVLNFGGNASKTPIIHIGRWNTPLVELPHPSRILRMREENPNASSLMEKKFIISLSLALKELSNA